METILITGGSGLVGFSLKHFSSFYPNYHMVFLSSNHSDLTNLEDTRKIFSMHKPTYVIHLAADVGGLFKNLNHKVSMFENNILINLHVLKACHEFHVKKVICCLSTCIFPDNTSYPIDETMLHNGPPHDSNYGYAYAKRMLEIQARTYREQFGSNIICIIPTNIYGPQDNFNIENGHVIPSLIHKCYLAKKNNQPFIVFGSGKPLRQFIFSYDLARMIITLLQSYENNDNIILSTNPSDEISIETVATYIAKEFQYENNLLFDTSKPDGQFKKTASNSKFISFYNNISNQSTFHFTSFQTGIQETIQWFIHNYTVARK